MAAADDVTIDLNEPESPAEDKAEPPDAEEKEDPNLAKKWSRTKKGREKLKAVGEQVFNDFEEDYENSSDYRDQMATNWELFAGKMPEKKTPFVHCANVNIPILLENTTRITFRAYAELFGDWNDVFGVAPIGPDDEATAKILTLHGNWQIRNQIPDFKRQMMRGMLVFFTMGDVVCHSYWDPARQQNRHEMLTADEFFSPFQTSTMPDYSDVPHYTLLLGKSKNDLIQMRTPWADVDKVLEQAEPSADDEPERKILKAAAETHGVDFSDRAAPYNLLQYEGWFNVDGEQHWCRVTADYATRTILEYMILEEVDWQDQERFDNQTQELDTWKAQTDQFHQALASQQAQMSEIQQNALQVADSGMAPPEQLQTVYSGLQAANQAHAQATPPPPPAWMKNPEDPTETPEPPRMVPLHMFTHIVNIEPMEGNLGLGQGLILASQNRAANTAANQFTDAATLNNCWSIIVGDGVTFDEPFVIRPGGINKATGATGTNIRESIIEVKPAPPSQDLMKVVELMDSKAQSVMQAPAVLSGDPGKSGETFRGISARIEQATKQLSVPTRRFADGVEFILKNNAKLNAQFLKDEELFHIAAGRGLIPQEVKVGRAMYERSYHVEIRADLKFSSQSQKVQEADELLALYRSIPQLQQNMCFLWHVLEMSLRAREQDALVLCLGPKPPYPPMLTGFPVPQPGAPPAAGQGPQGVPGVAAPPNVPQLTGLPAIGKMLAGALAK
jgi:hypothetical protein